MLNILSYIGVSLQSELCMWTLLGLFRTIFDATLFKVNANLKQVWQMSMPEQLSMPVQRVLRTIISGVMLVQCFTVYVYLASYIVLLYPVFLEERPTLVLPWLLLAAIRRFLCELTSLALGLGACVLLGPARPPCIKFVIFKVAAITPAFYMWMLVWSYYNALKMTSAFKRFPTSTMTSSDHDYGLELAVRRRRTKSLQDEEQLRKKLVASLYGKRTSSSSKPLSPLVALKPEHNARMVHSTHTNFQDLQAELLESIPSMNPLINEPVTSVGEFEDWCGTEITVPRDTDRILEQFAVMMLRIGACIGTEGTDPKKLFSNHSGQQQNIKKFDCSTPLNSDADAPPLVSTKGRTASYLENYPQIFMKKLTNDAQLRTESLLNVSQPQNIKNDGDKIKTLPKLILSEDSISTERTQKIAAILDVNKRFNERILSVTRSSDDINQKVQKILKGKDILNEHVLPTNLSSEEIDRKVQEVLKPKSYFGSQNTEGTVSDYEGESQPTTSKLIRTSFLSILRSSKSQRNDSSTTENNDSEKTGKVSYNIKSESNIHNTNNDISQTKYEKLSKSDTEINHLKEIIEKQLKRETEDVYDSQQSSVHSIQTKSGSVEISDSLQCILQRMRMSLPQDQRHAYYEDTQKVNNDRASNERSS